MGMRVEETLNAAAGVFEAMTDSKVQKTQKAFAAFMDNAARSNANMSADGGADKYIQTAVSDTKEKSDSRDYLKSSHEAAKQDAVKSDSRTAGAKSADEAGNIVEDEEKVVSDIENEILSLLAQKLGMTMEEISGMLEDMGMNAIDLLDGSNLLEFVMQINGVDDIGLVLTDENLMMQYKELTDEIEFISESVLKDNNISVNQLPQLVENVKADADDSLPTQNTALNPDILNNADESSDAKLIVENTRTQQDDSPFLQQNGESENHEMPMGMQNQNFTLGTMVDALNNVQVNYSAASMEEIVNQIVEQIKVQVNADTSSMEMQLNPESYGKLQLHVALKDGMVTAQMTVENEAVRQALESQVLQLRETMNNQGLKIEAIEVTVASHEFDRNLQQESDANQQAFEEEQKKSAVRRMNLNLNGQDWSEEMEELSDAEALERKIMLESGNRMSIQA